MDAPDARSPRFGPACLVPNLRALRVWLARERDPDAGEVARKRRRAVLIAGGLAATGIILSLLFLDAHAPGLRAMISPTVLAGLALLTRLGESPWMLVPTGLFCLVLLFVDWRRPARRVAAAWIELGCLVAYFFFAIVASGMVTNIAKWTLGRSRPVLYDTDGPYALHPISFHFEHVSFPSGHSTNAAAAAMALILIFRARPWVVILGAVFALSIAFSRIALQAHYPSDTIAGLFIGATGAFLLAHALGDRGVAFQSQADGSLKPKTIALRRVFKRGSGKAASRR